MDTKQTQKKWVVVVVIAIVILMAVMMFIWFTMGASLKPARAIEPTIGSPGTDPVGQPRVPHDRL